MSIDRTSPLKPVSTVQSRETPEAPIQRSLQGKSTTPKSTNVTLSDAQAKLIQPGIEDINMDRVEELKTAIRNGELKMDTGKIADALIQEAQSYALNNSSSR
ncbi:MAG TPA: flagellar biosynthesis anti-sigma factor FlgM [Buttiauxella sp.]|nr:flagellar biosynthesis anti-sigma factor FlgM [Buttiauxella sp.]